MADRAIVVGSGAGGAVSAMVLAEAGWDVLVLERGPNHFDDLARPAPAGRFGNDELKGPHRQFEYPDALAEPRVFRNPALGGPDEVGFVNALPATVGGGTVHWDAKTPRFWDIDFRKRSLLGPVDGADVRDWPFDYAGLAPSYDRIERLLGVQGDADAIPARPTGRHAPRHRPFPLPPGPAQYSSTRLAAGARAQGLHPFLMPAAVNSVPYDDRPGCTHCGFCCGYGCVSHARGSALVPLRRAVLAGAEVRADCTGLAVRWSGRRAHSVLVADRAGQRAVPADLVVLAASAVETCRLALLSELPDPAGLIGRCLMFHWFSSAYGATLDERVHAHRGRSSTHAVDDFADPDFPGAAAAAREHGLPYLIGGVVELGASPLGPIAEGKVYRRLLPVLAPEKPFGAAFQDLMRASVLRERLLGVLMHGEDLAQPGNRITVTAGVCDWLGRPVPMITYAPHRHELVAQQFYLPRLAAIVRAAGADVTSALAETRSTLAPRAPGRIPANFHTMGGMRMGAHPRDSVTDGWGRLHGLDNVVVADGSVFPTAGAHNPTLTIMATALRNATSLA
jgi:choline dehydrogenase-like flavoprotein